MPVGTLVGFNYTIGGEWDIRCRSPTQPKLAGETRSDSAFTELLWTCFHILCVSCVCQRCVLFCSVTMQWWPVGLCAGARELQPPPPIQLWGPVFNIQPGSGGGAPSGLQGHSPWSGGQGGFPLKLELFRPPGTVVPGGLMFYCWCYFFFNSPRDLRAP